MKLDPEIVKARLASVERTLAAAGNEALVVFATGSTLGPSSRTHGTMRYLCDWDSHHVPSVLVARFGEPPVILVPNVFMRLAAREHHWIADVRLVKVADFAREAAALLGRRRSIALVGRNEMPAPVWEALAESVPGAAWHDATGMLDALRVVKDAAQIAVHEHAAAICDDLFAVLAREIRTPRPVFQTQAEIERAARAAGCEFIMTWLTVAPAADYCRFFKEECARVPERGDQVFLGIYLIYEGHWGHAIRGGTIGPPAPAHRRVYGVAREMLDAMLEKLRPGKDLNRLHDAAEAVLAQHFPGDDAERIFRFRHGHSLGLSYEDPIASAPFPQLYDATPAPRAPLAVRPGMLFEFHPNLFVPGLAGAAVGDMVLATDAGPRILTRYSLGLAEL